ESHANHLRVSGFAAAHFAIGGIGSVAAGVADRRAVDAFELPELPFRAPEAAHREHRQLFAWKRGLHRGAEDRVLGSDRHPLRPARQGFTGAWHLELWIGPHRAPPAKWSGLYNALAISLPPGFGSASKQALLAVAEKAGSA